MADRHQVCPDCKQVIRLAGPETCEASTCSAAGHYVCQVWKTKHKPKGGKLGHHYTFIRAEQEVST